MYPGSLNTEHAIDVVVGALLALTDGRLDDMQTSAEADGGTDRLNAAIEAAQALGGKQQT